MINQISESFCAIPWKQAILNLEQELVQSCHLHKALPSSEKLVSENPSQLYNSPEQKNIRTQLCSNLKPIQCNQCWQTEDNKNLQKLSLRQYNNNNISFEELFFYNQPENLNKNFNPSHIELTFNSQQNSTTPNVATQAFWRWWPELFNNLESLIIKENQTFLTQDIWHLLDYFGDHGGSKNIKISIECSFNYYLNLIERFIEKSYYCNHLTVIASLQLKNFNNDFTHIPKLIQTIEHFLIHSRIEKFWIHLDSILYKKFTDENLFRHFLELQNKFSLGFIEIKIQT